MTDTATVRTDQAEARPAHPLDQVSAAEYRAGREVLAAAGLLGESVRFAYYGLDEPPKDDVLGGRAAAPPAAGIPHRRHLRRVE